MCCLVSSLVLAGPRVAVLLWWLFDSGFVRDAIPHLFWLIVGIILAPWTVLFYLVAFISGSSVGGWDWLLIAVGILFDLASYSSGAWGNRKRFAH